MEGKKKEEKANEKNLPDRISQKNFCPTTNRIPDVQIQKISQTTRMLILSPAPKFMSKTKKKKIP